MLLPLRGAWPPQSPCELWTEHCELWTLNRLEFRYLNYVPICSTADLCEQFDRTVTLKGKPQICGVFECDYFWWLICCKGLFKPTAVVWPHNIWWHKGDAKNWFSFVFLLFCLHKSLDIILLAIWPGLQSHSTAIRLHISLEGTEQELNWLPRHIHMIS